MKHLIYISIIVFFALSCRKTSTVTIQAQNINNLTDGSAYAGMEYYVVESWIPFYQSKSKRIASGTLDANGKAVFEVKMNPNRGTTLNISQPDNICYGGTSTSLKHENNNTINFKYATCGYLNLPRVNINCEGINDKFRLKYFYTNNPDIYIYTGFIDENHNWQSDKFIAGCIDYSDVNVYHALPVGNYTVEWQIERPSGITNGIHLTSLAKNDTTNYLIEY